MAAGHPMAGGRDRRRRIPFTRARLLEAFVRLSETERAERTLAELGEQDREPGELRIAKAVLWLAPGDPPTQCLLQPGPLATEPPFDQLRVEPDRVRPDAPLA